MCSTVLTVNVLVPHDPMPLKRPAEAGGNLLAAANRAGRGGDRFRSRSLSYNLGTLRNDIVEVGSPATINRAAVTHPYYFSITRRRASMKSASIIGNINPNTPIYRIFSREYFFELFESKQNALVLPKKWSDPFENVFLRSPVRFSSDGEVGTFGFRDDLYGQCWTRGPVSEAIWQIYSRDESGIRVRTTAGKLIDSMREAHGEWSNTSCFIGHVKYMTDKQLREFGKTAFLDQISSRVFARSLLVKRKAYRFENEVRLIYFDHDKVRNAQGIYKYKIDPFTVFDQVMIDGRVPVEEFSALKREIVERTGISSRRVRRSSLYSAPKDFVVYVP